MSQDQLAPALAPRWTPARSAAGRHNPWLIALIISIATFMEVLDTSIANVALRNIGGSMAAGVDESTWVITSYLVANAIILPISGWLTTVIGRKRFYLICTVLFTLSSLLCGMATSLPMLIFFRVLQGLAGGGLVPVTQAMLADSFPPAQRGQAFAFSGIAIVVAPALGPPLGGWLTDTYSWRWIFLINVPVGILSLFLGALFVHEPPILVTERKDAVARGLRVDYIGFALAALGLACLEVMNSKGERLDWFESPFVRTVAVISAVSLVTMVVWEWFQKEPVVDIRLFRSKTFSISFLMMFAIGFVLYSSTTVLPMLLQGAHGYTALTAGWALMPGGVATFIFMPVIGSLTKRVQLRYILCFGFAVQAIALYYMSGFAPDLTYRQAVWARIYQSAFLGAMFVPIMTLSYDGLAPGQSNNASALVNIARNFGGSFGIAMANTWLAQRTQFHHHRLIENINPYNAAWSGTDQSMTAFFQSGGADPVRAAQQSYAAAYATLNLQAYLKAFCDLFLILAVVAAVMLLLIPLLPRIKAGHEVHAH